MPPCVVVGVARHLKHRLDRSANSRTQKHSISPFADPRYDCIAQVGDVVVELTALEGGAAFFIEHGYAYLSAASKGMAFFRKR